MKLNDSNIYIFVQIITLLSGKKEELESYLKTNQLFM